MEHWVELRIHGVSGTPPEDMLGVPHVTQVAGDARRRVFRPSNDLGEEVGRDEDGRLLEGFHWGNLTSGSWRQGLWLLLIPFGLVNAAQFMLSPPSPRLSGYHAGLLRRWFATAFHVVCGAMLRFLAFTLTCVLVLAATFLFADVGGMRRMQAAESFSDSLKHGRMAAAGIVVVLALIYLLWWVSKSAYRPQPDKAATPSLSVPSELAHWGFFSKSTDVPALRRLHLVGGAAMALIPGALTLERDHPENVWAERVSRGSIGTVVVVAAAVLLLGDPSLSASLRFESRAAIWFKRMVGAIGKGVGWAGSAVAAFLAVVELFLLVRVQFADTDTRTTNSLGYLDSVSEVMLLAIGAAVVGLAVANVLLACLTHGQTPGNRPSHRFGRFAWGLTPFFVASTGVLLGLGFAGAISYAGAKAFKVKTADFPVVLERIAYAWGITALAVVALVVVLMGSRWWFATRSPRIGLSVYRSRARIDFSADRGQDRGFELEWEKAVAAAMWMARLKTFLPRIVVGFVALGVGMSAFAVGEVIAAHSGAGNGTATNAWHLRWNLDWISETRAEGAHARVLIWIGTWTLLALASGLVTVGRGAVRAQSKRRTANIIWDVIAFWPHSVHPFAPPPYSQLAAIRFRDRIRWHLAGNSLPDQDDEELDPEPVSYLAVASVGDRVRLLFRRPTRASRRQSRPDPPPTSHVRQRVVVTAHSQGSLVTLAALLWLTDEERKHVGLVTHGSQLQVAFPRAFPAYVNLYVLQAVLDALDGRWVNLYRETDHIAGPVHSWDHWERRAQDRADAIAEWTAGADQRPRHIYKSCTHSSAEIRCLDALYSTGLRVCGHDWRILDPRRYDTQAETGPVAQTWAHSRYISDPAWKYAVNAVGGAHRLRPYGELLHGPGDGVEAVLPE